MVGDFFHYLYDANSNKINSSSFGLHCNRNGLHFYWETNHCASNLSNPISLLSLLPQLVRFINGREILCRTDFFSGYSSFRPNGHAADR